MIFAAALLDEMLAELLRAACRQKPEDVKANVDPLFQGYAPLATFSGKAQVAFAFGLLPRDLRNKIEIIRRLRNDFAHESGPIDFDDPRCTARLELVIDRVSMDTVQEEPFVSLIDTPLAKRLSFVLSVQRIIGEIRAYATLAKEGKNLRNIIVAIDERDEHGQ